MSCVFCEIVAGRITSSVVLEDDDCVVFLDIAPAADGHLLVVPREHCADIFEATHDIVTACARMTKQAAELLTRKLGAPGISVVQSNGAAAGQDVFHMHTHVIPRGQGDDLQRFWQARPETAERLGEVRRKLLD